LVVGKDRAPVYTLNVLDDGDNVVRSEPMASPDDAIVTAAIWQTAAPTGP